MRELESPLQSSFWYVTALLPSYSFLVIFRRGFAELTVAAREERQEREKAGDLQN